MKHLLHLALGCALLWASNSFAATNIDWDELPPLPEPRSGHFAGVHNDALIVAGGSNFLVSPFEGGEKQWYFDVFVLERGGEWIRAGALPRARAYGVTVETGGGLLLIGGSDGTTHYTDTIRIGWQNGSLTIEENALPELPQPMAFMSGAYANDTIHLVGGQIAPDSQVAIGDAFLLADGSDIWDALAFPGAPRILAVVGAQADSVFVFSGATLYSDDEGNTAREYLSDGHQLTDGEWSAAADSPTPLVAAGVLPAGGSHLLVFSGDAGEFNGRNDELRDNHPGFPATIYAYHTITDTWVEAAEVPEALVTTTAVKWGDDFIIPAGEDRPGHRSAKVHRGKLIPMKGNFSALDYGVIALYTIILVGMGVYFSRRENTTEAFFLGGRRIPWWAVGISLFGTSLSAITYLTVPASAYATDWILMLNQYGVIIFAPLVVALYIPKYREHPIATAYAYLERRFNVLLRIYGSLNFTLFQVGRMSIVMFLPAIALSTATGVDLRIAIVVMGVVSTLYTVLGGIEAVIWTDVIQTVVLTFGAIVAFIIVFMNVDLGIGEAIAVAAEAGKFHAFNWSFSMTDATVWVIIVGSTLSNAYPITADQTMVQRYLTTEDAKGAGRALWIHAWLAVPASFLFFGLGTALWIYFRENPGVLDPALLNDATLPLFIVAEFPAGLKGLIIAGVFAATMSSLDSSINSLSSVMVTDYYRRFVPDVDDQKALRVAKILTLFFGTIGTLGALYLSTLETRSIFESFLTFLNLVGGGVGGVFALGVMTKRANSIGTLIGAIVSAIVVVYVWKATAIHGLAYGAIGFSTSVIVGYLVSMVTGKPSAEPTA